MKKFKTRNSINKIRIMIIIFIFLIIFIIFSSMKLKSNNTKFINTLLNAFNRSNNNNLYYLTANLDHLFTSYTFYEKKEIYKKEEKVVYLYNTHDTEKYSDNTYVDEATKLLRKNLNKLGVKVLVEEEKVSDLISTGLLPYDISRTFINNAISENKNIKYFIDIHRDSVSDTKVKINGKNYAKILFVLGLYNKNYQKNKETMLLMNNYLDTNYPGISKGIYEKKGNGVDGIYNQDLNENVLLIEIGGVTNNIEEVENSTEILALMLYHILGD